MTTSDNVFGLLIILFLSAPAQMTPIDISKDSYSVDVATIDWSKVKLAYLVPNDLNDYLREIEKDLKFASSAFEDSVVVERVGLKNRIPYQVGLLLSSPSETTWCSGALISNQFVLTAAHCLDSVDKAIIFIGANNVQARYEPGRIVTSTINTNFIIHEKWDRKDMLNDIALIKLPIAVQYSENIQPVYLPINSSSDDWPTNSDVVMSGWSQCINKIDASINQLVQPIKTTIINKDMCRKYYGKYIHDENVCFTATDDCVKDTGGPLVFKTRGFNILVGVASYRSLTGSEGDWPGVYLDVRFYIEWINGQAGI